MAAQTSVAAANDPHEQDHDGYSRELVPVEATGSGWRVFFIVAGSLCGLPVFILSAHLTAGFSLPKAYGVMLFGGLISGVLGGLSAYCGARTRMTLGLLAQLSFGRVGAQLVKLVIAAALIGWFGVGVSVLGETAAKAVAQIVGVMIPPFVFSLPLTIAIAVVTLRGVQGLERLGQIIVPLVGILVFVSIGLAWRRSGGVPAHPNGGLTFSTAVSAVTGSYIVGIVIQPDYGRFVRRPLAAGLAAGVALGIAYPAILILSSIPAAAIAKPDLIAAMIALGLGIPALAIMLLGAWIDASACLYSGSLSLANQFPRLHLNQVVIAATILGAILALCHAGRYFITFLEVLGLILPPLAAAQITRALLTPREALSLATVDASPAVRWGAVAAVIAGGLVGFAESQGWIRLSSLATVDSIAVAASIVLALEGIARLRGRSTIKQHLSSS